MSDLSASILCRPRAPNVPRVAIVMRRRRAAAAAVLLGHRRLPEDAAGHV